MKKTNELLKRIEMFERLAVYGDRRSFLQTLSQSADIEQFPPSSNAGINAPYVPGTKPPVAKPPAPTPVDESFPSASNLGVNAPFPGNFQPVTLNTQPLFPMTHIPQNTPKKTQNNSQLSFNPKVLKVQNLLNQELSLGGNGQAVMSPITPDGKLGPETLKALKVWQQKHNLPDLNSAFISVLSRSNSGKIV